ncbi:DUF1254 domain-containing protein [Vibrio sp. SCSIO 43135]|uniref:DUF1214 domain-containing protein n=1 Tax=Vibrio sp. SCSIO 43135 TaxID=2819096 RepID=UPI0020757F95|nr:DUF1214 domain-containing protein [Vibrio sp. SCSIO 43135]USD42361.1 DUF1254 domain-containing protein [Vibrio sp. SCSIO 43135]
MNLKHVTTKVAIGITIVLASNTFASNLGFDVDKVQFEPVESVDEFREDLFYIRAFEVLNFYRPASQMWATIDELAKHDVHENDIAYMGRIQDSDFKWPTANGATQFALGSWDLENGPVVVEVPKSGEVGIFGVLTDAFQRPMVDIGNDGVEGGKGGKYFLYASNYNGPVPKGYIPVPSKTYTGHSAIRLLVPSLTEENQAKAVEHAKKIKVYQYGKKEETIGKHVDLSRKLLNLYEPLGFNSFEQIKRIIDKELVDSTDKGILGMASELGLEKGQPFNPSDKEVALFKKAADAAQDHFRHRYLLDIPPYYEGQKTWRATFSDDIYETRWQWEHPNRLEYEERGAIYQYIYGSITRIAGVNWYLNGYQDSDGEILDGGKSYKLTVPANVPAQRFWSTTLTDDQFGVFLDTPEKKQAVNSYDQGLEINQDGSTTIYYGPKAPKGKEANWVPTQPGVNYFVMFRFYNAEAPATDKSWKLNDIEKATW